jgi:predicted glycosyltransferase involved in capsule biosynthesis
MQFILFTIFSSILHLFCWQAGLILSHLWHKYSFSDTFQEQNYMNMKLVFKEAVVT